ncbi:MAG: DoxX family protein [Betaproteobacteria bacterium]|nr:DoxX family protein [Betaproteobacteria bacterium]
MNALASLLPALGRVLLAVIFLIRGLSKLAAAAATIGYIASAGLPLPLLGYAVALVVEIGGGLLMLAGFQARITAWVLAVFTLVAAVIFHHDFADQNQMIHFLKNLAIAGGFLQVAAFGAGNFSIDARRAPAKAKMA